MTSLGYLYVRFFIKLKKFDNVTKQTVLEYLKKNPFVGWLGTQEGYYDIVATLLVKDIYELETWVQKFNFLFSKFLEEKNLSVGTSVLSYKNMMIHGFKDPSFSYAVGKLKRVEVDELDLLILKKLSKDCTITIVKLSQQLSKDFSTIRKRIDRLQDTGVIQEYRSIFNYSLLGYHYYHVFLYLKDFQKEDEKELLSYLQSNSAVLYLVRALDEFDLEFEIVVKNHLELSKVMNKIKSKFSGIVKKTESSLIRNVHKSSFMPTI